MPQPAQYRHRAGGTPIGKIARLPHAIREQLNRKLLDNQAAPDILAWLNALPETAAAIADLNRTGRTFGGRVAGPIDERNLSKWRYTGYAAWLKQRDRLLQTRDLAAYAHDLAQAKGGDIAQGAAAIAAGRILEAMEAAADAGADPATLKDLITAVSSLRAGDIAQQKADIAREQLKQKNRELELAETRFQRETCNLFLKWNADERARQVAAGQGSNEEKIEQLGQIMFGQDWRK